MKDNQEIAKDYTDWMVKTGGFARDMTLRNHFAGLAMQSLTRRLFAHEVLESKHYAEDVSKAAYIMADDMLKECAK
jgi:hypothetical protein